MTEQQQHSHVCAALPCAMCCVLCASPAAYQHTTMPAPCVLLQFPSSGGGASWMQQSAPSQQPVCVASRQGRWLQARRQRRQRMRVQGFHHLAVGRQAAANTRQAGMQAGRLWGAGGPGGCARQLQVVGWWWLAGGCEVMAPSPPHLTHIIVMFSLHQASSHIPPTTQPHPPISISTTSSQHTSALSTHARPHARFHSQSAHSAYNLGLEPQQQHSIIYIQHYA